jgi:hypothetical protein
MGKEIVTEEKEIVTEEIEITPKMIEAGGAALVASDILPSPFADIDKAVTKVFKAMKAAAKNPAPQSPAGQSRQTTGGCA